MFLTKLSDTDSVRVARWPEVTDQHRVARLAFAWEHQNWQVHYWRPVLFTDESRFTLSSCDRHEESGDNVVTTVVPATSSSCFGSGSSMEWEGTSLEGRTDLHVLASCSLITVSRIKSSPIVTPYASGGFLLVQDNALNDGGTDAIVWPWFVPDLNLMRTSGSFYIGAPDTNR